MTEMKIGITVLDKKETYIKTELTMVGIGETFRVSIEIDEKSKDIVFDILCLPSLGGLAIYGIYDKGTIGILEKIE